MAKFKWDTRQQFIDLSRQSNPQEFNGSTDDEVYQKMVDRFPEYQQQIAENYEIPTAPDTYPEIDEDLAGEKNAFTALNEIFGGKDTYKYLPFVRDAEFFEIKKLLDASKALENGTANDEQINMLKAMTEDDSRERTMGYNVLTTVAESVAFGLEIGASTLLSVLTGGAATPVVAGVAAKQTAKTGAKKGVRQILKQRMKIATKEASKKKLAQAVEKKLGKTAAGRVAVGQAGLKVGAQAVGQTLKGAGATAAKSPIGAGIRAGWDDLGKMQFQKDILWAAKQAGKRKLGTSIKALARKEGTSVGRMVAGTVGTGVRQAAVQTVFRSPLAINNAMERMIPEYNLIQDPLQKDELLLEVLDEGDNILPALAKGYADMGIEFFSEMTGESLYLMHNLWGKHILKPGAMAKMFPKASGALGAKYQEILQAPLKGAILRHLMPHKTGGDLMDNLRIMGWNGVVGEMFEERVGDVLRTGVGLQDSAIPTPEQLLTEAISFTLSGGLMGAAATARKSKILGGVGVEQYNLIEKTLNDATKDQVLTSEEFKQVVNDIADTYKEQRENPNKIIEALRNFEIKGVKPFESLTRQGSVDYIMKEHLGRSMTAHIAKAVESGTDVHDAAADFTQRYLKSLGGVYVVNSEEAREIRKKQIETGDLRYRDNGMYEGVWTMSEKAYQELNGADEQAFLQADFETISKLQSEGLLDATVLAEKNGTNYGDMFLHDPNSVEGANAIDALAKMIGTRNIKRAGDLYGVLQKIVQNEKKIRPNDPMKISLAANVIVRDQKKNWRKKQYHVEGRDEEMETGFVAGLNRDGVISIMPYAETEDLFEEYLEAGVNKMITDAAENTNAVGIKAVRQVESLMAIAESLENEKGREIKDLKGTELFSKIFITEVLGLSRGRYTEAIRSMQLGEQSKKDMENLVKLILGEDLVNFMKKESGAITAAETPSEAEQAEAEQSTTQEAETPSESAEEAPAATESETPVRSALEEAVSTPEEADVLPAIHTAESAMEQTLNVEQDHINQIRSLLADESVSSNRDAAKLALEYMDAKNLHFAIHRLDEGIPDDIAAMRDAERGAYFDIPEYQQMLRSNIIRKMNQLKSQPGATSAAGMDTMMDLLQDTKAADLVKILKSYESFKSWLLNSTPLQDFNDDMTLWQALHAVLVNEQGATQDARLRQTHDQLIAMLHLYEDAFRFVAKKMVLENGTYKIHHVNKRNPVKMMHAFLDRRLRYLASRPDMLETVTFGMDSPLAYSRTHLLMKMEDITGIPKGYLQALPTGIMKKLVKGFAELEMDNLSLPESRYKAMKGYFYDNQTDTHFVETIGLKANVASSNSAMFYDVTGDLSSSVRMDSHMARFVRDVAKKLGINQDSALMVLSGIESDRNNPVKGKSMRKKERTKAWLEIYKQNDNADLPGHYYMSLGQLGDKQQMYGVLVQKFKETELPGQMKWYKAWYEALTAKEQTLFMSPTKVSGSKKISLQELWEQIQNTPGEAARDQLMFAINNAINFAKVAVDLHGSFQSFAKKEGGDIDLFAVVKRASQIGTSGWAMKGEKWNAVVVNDYIIPRLDSNGKPMKDDKGNVIMDPAMDGQTIFFNEFGKRYAGVAGKYEMEGNDIADSIKANYYSVDPVSKLLTQIKSNAVNADSLNNNWSYRNLSDYVRLHNKLHPENRIDQIVPLSSLKVNGARHKIHDLLMYDEKTGRVLVDETVDFDTIEINGEDFITAQNLGHTNFPKMANIGKQMKTDTIFLPSREIILSDEEKIIKIATEIIDELDKVRKQSDENVIKDSLSKIERLLKIQNPKGKLAEREDFIGKMMLDVFRTIEWTGDIRPEYHYKAFQAINNDMDLTNPHYKRLIQQVKGRFILQKNRLQLRRNLQIKVSSMGEKLGDFRLSPNGTELNLPGMRSNVRGVRPEIGFPTENELMDFIKNEGPQYWNMDDLYVLDKEGNTTTKLRDGMWEIRNDEENPDKKWFVLTGGWIIESRIPAENLHSHIPHRLVGSFNKFMKGNLAAVEYAIAQRKGEDDDGDMGYGTTLIRQPKNILEELHNKILRTMINDYTKVEMLPTVRTKVNAQIHKDFAIALAKETGHILPALHLNDVNDQELINGIYSDALEALGRVAASNKWWDLARYAGVQMRPEGMLSMQTSDISVGFGLMEHSDNVVQNVLHKVLYSTDPMNIALDDKNDPWMHLVNLNEITLPIYQAMLAMHSNFESEEAGNRYAQSVIRFINSKMMRDFVDIKRETQEHDYSPTKIKVDDQERTEYKSEYIRRKMKARGHESSLKMIERLNGVLEEATKVAQLMDSQYKTPRSAAFLKRDLDTLQQIKDNRLDYFDTERLMKDGRLIPELQKLERVLNDLKANAFNTSILFSPAMALIETHLDKQTLDNPWDMELVEKIFDRQIMINATAFNMAPAKDMNLMTMHLVRRLTEMRREATEKGETNWFADVLDVSQQFVKGLGAVTHVRVNEFYEDGMPDFVMEQARKSYDAMPQEDQIAFAYYMYAVYGPSEWMKTGSWSKLIGDKALKMIDERVSKVTSLFFDSDTGAKTIIDSVMGRIKKNGLQSDRIFVNTKLIGAEGKLKSDVDVEVWELDKYPELSKAMLDELGKMGINATLLDLQQGYEERLSGNTVIEAQPMVQAKPRSQDDVIPRISITDLPQGSRKDYVGLDFETTGTNEQGLKPDARTKNALEISVKDLGTNEIRTWRIKPTAPYFAESNEWWEGTGIKKDRAAKERTFAEIWPQIKAFIGDKTIMAYNAPFDRAVMEAELEAMGEPMLENKWYDAYDLAQKEFPHRQGKRGMLKLQHIGPLITGVQFNAHQADADVEMMVKLVDKIYERHGLHFAIKRMNEGVLPLSLRMMSGAEGIHKIWLKHYNQSQSELFLGEFIREYWERMVGARDDYRSDHKLTPAERERGMNLLKALTALYQLEEKVQIDEVQETLSVAEALEKLWEYRRRSLSDSTSKWENTVNLKRSVTQLVREGWMEKPGKLSANKVRKLVLEAELKKEAAKNEGNMVTIRLPIYSDMTAQEIVADYQKNKADWMIDAEELKKEVRKAFDEALDGYNTTQDLHIDQIPHREDYVPVYLQSMIVRSSGASQRDSVAESNTRAMERSNKGITYGRAPVTSLALPQTNNIAELYERWRRESANHKMMAASWQLLFMGRIPDGSPVIIPEFNADVKNGVIPQEMIEHYAEEFGYVSEKALEGIASMRPKNEYGDFARFETGIPSMPVVWVRKDKTQNLVKMILNVRKEGKMWKVWERIVNWTKFMAIGVPYMSYFHKAALAESAIAARGLKASRKHYDPVAAYKEFKKFVNNLNEDPSLGQFWLSRGLQGNYNNPDFHSGIIEKDLLSWGAWAKENGHGYSAKGIDKLLTIKKRWDRRLWTDFHAPLKIMTAQSLLVEAQDNWAKDGKPLAMFPEDQAAEEIAVKVNAMFGGNNFSRFLWATPTMMQVLNAMGFAFDWTYSAASVAGAGNVPFLRGIFGRETHLQNTINGKYWPAFAVVVAFGIPQAIQLMIWAASSGLGDDDQEPFTFLNEHERRTWIDISPLADAVRAVPVIGRTMGKDDGRKTYIRWGKQAYEVGGWITSPIETVGHKLSIPLKTAIEHISGQSVGGWDMAFKDADYWGVMAAQGSFWKGRVGDIAMRFIPFTAQDIIRERPVVWFAKAKRGKHGWYATKQLTELYLGYVSELNWDTTKNHKREVLNISADILKASSENGFDARKIQKDALQNTRAELYLQLESALRKNQIKKADNIAIRLKAMEAMALSIQAVYQKNGIPSGKSVSG